MNTHKRSARQRIKTLRPSVHLDACIIDAVQRRELARGLPVLGMEHIGAFVSRMVLDQLRHRWSDGERWTFTLQDLWGAPVCDLSVVMTGTSFDGDASVDVWLDEESAAPDAGVGVNPAGRVAENGALQ